jgi:hypothetical protein
MYSIRLKLPKTRFGKFQEFFCPALYQNTVIRVSKIRHTSAMGDIMRHEFEFIIVGGVITFIELLSPLANTNTYTRWNGGMPFS